MRFWFPVVYLEKPPPGYRKSPTLRGVNAPSFLVHAKLLKCEAALCSMYCRRVLLSLGLPSSLSVGPALDHLQVHISLSLSLTHTHTHTHTKSHQLVAVDSLSEPLMEGSTTTTSPDLAPSPQSYLSLLDSSPLPLFYSHPSRVLSKLSAILRTLPLVSYTAYVFAYYAHATLCTYTVIYGAVYVLESNTLTLTLSCVPYHCRRWRKWPRDSARFCTPHRTSQLSK